MEYEEFDKWIGEVFTRFWATGMFRDVDMDTLLFLYEDDATPEEVSKLYEC